jgi:hypothetical protein
MKKAVFISIFTAVLAIALLLSLVTSESDNQFVSKLAVSLGARSDNLLKNADFTNGLEGWKYDLGVQILETNGAHNVYIANTGKRKLSIRQDVNVTSGNVYRFSFRFTGPASGGQARYRNTVAGTERVVECDDEKDSGQYVMEIKCKGNRNDSLYLTSAKKGEYYFAKPTFYTVNKSLCSVYNWISLVLYLALAIVVLKYNIVFTILILALFVTPLLKISDKKASKVENRNLAIYKGLLIKNKKDKSVSINKNYGVDFNSWLNDRFFLREDILKDNNTIKNAVNNRYENQFITAGRDGFYFKRSDIRNVMKKKNYPEEEYKKSLASFRRLNDFCKKNNIELYILITPYGSEVYCEKLRGMDLRNYAGCYSNTINRINQELGMNILFAFDTLMEAKKEGLAYYKTDHHWSPLGAYKGYRLIMDEIIKRHPDLQPSGEENYKISLKKTYTGFGTFFGQLNLLKDDYENAYPKDDYYLEYKFKGNSIFGTWNDMVTDKSHAIIKNSMGYDKKVFFFGDSFIRNSYPFFTHTFKETQVYFKRVQIYMPDIEAIIKDYKPDIVILTVYAENTKRIKSWYDKSKRE